MDELDRRILDAVQSHSDLPIAELAEKIGLSHTPCWRRLKRLEQEGFIRGRVTLLCQKKLGLAVTVFVNVRLQHHDEATLEAFEQAARDRPEIVECFSMGGDSDYILRVVVADIDEYEGLLKRVLLHFPGVESIKSNFALKCIKLTSKLPIRAIPRAEHGRV
jgi:Lrp/AsnC family transcriptional regulator